MKRRTLLATAGALVGSGVAGCTDAGTGDPGASDDTTTSPTDGGGQTSRETDASGAPLNHPGTVEESFAANGDFPRDEGPADGLPPSFGNPPPAPDADPSTFEINPNDERVLLAPIDVVEAWYYRGEARIVDARGLDQYTLAHVYGAVSSPAQPGSRGGGIDGWPADARVVTYCGCPHHLSSIRAAGLKRAGFSEVYALDEGFGEWVDRANPMAGTAFREGQRAAVAEWTLAGRVDPRHAGEYVWASAERQYEAAPVRADGSFELTVGFPAATGETPVRVDTPDFTVRRPLAELAGTNIDAGLTAAHTDGR